MNIVWINRLSRYGLSKSIILVLFLLSLLSIITQMMGLGIFIPVFEYIFSGNEALNGDSKGSVFYFVTFI